MKKHNGYRIGKKIKYLLDDYISKGFGAQILLLAGIALILTLLFGVIAVKLGEPNYPEGYWTSLMHMLDSGAITGDEAGTSAYFLFMLLVTFVGMAFTGTIVAIVNNGMQNKLNELKSGRSVIVEKNHVLILGFDAGTCTICRELLEGGLRNGERVRIVIADELPKETVERAVKEYMGKAQHSLKESVKNWQKNKRIKVLVRSGNPTYENTLAICAAESAKTIYINREDDSETIRILLALATYLKKNHAYIGDEQMPTLIAIIHEKQNMIAAEVAAGIDAGDREVLGNKIRILNDKRLLGQLSVQACVHQGLPYVLDGLFNYQGSSIFIERPRGGEKDREEFPLVGKNLQEITAMVTEAIPLGFARKEAEQPVKILLNPPKEEYFRPEDCLIYLSDKRKLNLDKPAYVEPLGRAVCGRKQEDAEPYHFLVIGRNGTLPDMINNVKGFCGEGLKLSLIASENDSLPESDVPCRRITCPDAYCWEYVEKILEENSFWFDPKHPEKLTNIGILSQEGSEGLVADEKTMLLLLNIRRFLKERGVKDIGITSEMVLSQNQDLLQNDSINDYVIASELSDRMMAQFLDDPRKCDVIGRLLRPGKADLLLNPLTDYADTAQTFNFEGVFRIAAEKKKEIPLGWICFGHEEGGTDSGKNTCLVLNPSEEERQKRYEGGDYSDYRLVVFAGKAQKPVA